MSIPCKMRPAGLDSLPLGYTRLEFLESSGNPTTQFIITDVCLGDESEVVFSASYYNDTNRICGSILYGETYSYLVGIGSNGKLYIRLRNYEQSFVYTPAAGHDKKHVVYLGENEVTLNGNVISAANYKMPEYPPGVRVTLFREVSWRANGEIDSYAAGKLPSRIYGYKGWRDGALIGNYIPALDNTGRPCMFDTVSRKSFYNAGTGADFRAGLTLDQVRRLELPPTGGALTLVVQNETFYDPLALEVLSRAEADGWNLTVLPQESDIPKTYTRLDYLESSGKQWITVDEPFDANTGLLFKGACTEAQGTGQTWLFSVESNVDGINWYGVRIFYNKAYQGILMSVGIYVPYTIREIERTYPLTYSFNYECDREFSIDGDVLIKTLPSEYPELSSDKFALFAAYDFLRGTVPWRSSVRIFDFVVSQGKYVTRNFVPALDQSGTPCMFDIYSRQTHYNDPTATAPFIVGMTLEQVRELKLPTGGGTITLALPYEASIDGKAQAALETARAQGWTLTIRYDDIKLPPGYMGIAYLEGSGQQYITTDLTTSNKTEIRSTVQIIATYTGTTQYYRLFGNATSADVPRLSYTLMLGNSLSGASRFGTSSANVGWNAEYPIDGVYEYVRSNKECGVVGVYVARGDWSTSWTCSAKLQIFAWNSAMAPVGRVYSFFVQEDGALKGCFIPALDDEGVPCMFDTISGKSYRSSGTLPFIAGMTLEQVRNLNLPAGGGELTITAPAEVFTDTLAQEALSQAEANGWTIKVADKDSKLPITYDRLEYLESTGEQYIDTGYVPDNESGIYLYQLKTTQGDFVPMGCRNDSSTATRFYALRAMLQGDSSTGFGWGGWKRVAAIHGLSKTYTNYMNSRVVESENIDPIALAELSFTPEYSIFMFAANIGGVASLSWSGRIYETAISQGESTAMSFVPALDPTGAPCMFDTVTQTAFYNDGAGADFLYPGSEQQAATYGLRNRNYAQLTEHGLRRLYHVPAGCDLNKDVYAAQNGFKILVDTPKPEEGYWKPVWVEKEYSIELEWVETDPPEDDAQTP